MERNKVSMKEVIRNIGARNLISVLIVLVVAVGVIGTITSSLYSYVKSGIYLRTEMNARQSAEEFEKYLLPSINSVLQVGNNIDHMLQQGRPNREILDFIVKETENVKRSIDKDYTGLYGWINGEYLDSAGWGSDKEYDPRKRPWYTQTMMQGDRLVLIKPYMDMQTHSVVTTITYRFLSNSESVLALDVDLKKMQGVIERIAKSSPHSFGVVLDQAGGVVVHSEPREVGKDYLLEHGTLGSQIARNVIREKQKQFELSFEGTTYIIYADEIRGGWYSISAVNLDEASLPLKRILAASILLLMLTVLVIGAVFFRMSKRDLITRNMNRQLMTIGDLFDSMIEIDIPIDLFREIDGDEHTKLGTEGERGQAQAVLNAAVLLKVDESFREQLFQFVDLSTLSERMLGKDTITTEFLDTKQAWYRGRFIVAERDSEGNVMRVLWIIHSIDEEKKERARLVQLTETDGLTGIANRRGGEQKIRELVQEGKGGMFIILDVNLFKSINDTYGHQTGDKALTGIANCLKEAFRSGDVVLRLGGDEFAAFAIGATSQAAGQGIIERLFAHVNALRIPEMGGNKITISVGATFFDGSQNLRFQDLYEQADASVYISKDKDKSESHVTFYEG
jgi:diguanylate cyclase (GGDEF)-like protein